MGMRKECRLRHQGRFDVLMALDEAWVIFQCAILQDMQQTGSKKVQAEAERRVRRERRHV